jgi:hypothetical protein
MAHVNKKPVPNMVGMRANAEKALIMKDMGNGHMRPFMWGAAITVTSGESEALVASGTMSDVYVDNGVYAISDGDFRIAKDAVEHTVKVKKLSGDVADDFVVDVVVFMSTATTVDVNDYTGKRGYQTGNY